MSSPRARANEAIYLAKIVNASWARALAEQDVPASVLARAFLPPVRGHLIAAYGWFLLHVSQVASVPEAPPRCCAELPGVPQGRVVPPEIAEFERLESSGWLAELLAEGRPVTVAISSTSNLAVAAPAGNDPAQVERWIGRLEAQFERMDNSLDEF